MTYIERMREAIRAELPDALLAQTGIDELLLFYALLAATRGVRTTREDVHDAWVTWQVSRGQTHAAMVPFGKLSAGVRAEDEPYVAAIRRAAARIRSTGHR